MQLRGYEFRKFFRPTFPSSPRRPAATLLPHAAASKKRPLRWQFRWELSDDDLKENRHLIVRRCVENWKLDSPILTFILTNK